MSADGCSPSRSSGVPRWILQGRSGTWGLAVWLPFLLAEPIAHATEADAPWSSWPLLAVIVATFVGLAIIGHRRLTGWAGVRHLEFGLLAVQAGASTAVVAGSPESSMLFPLLMIAAVVALDGRWGLTAVPVVTGLSALVVGAAEGSSAQVTTTVVSTLLTGLGCWSFRRLFVVIAELTRTREALAQLAVAQERERFSRDLHDLLGHTLSVIVVKAQAVRRLARLDADAVAEHASDIETIGRRALTEVRQAVDGYRGTGLAVELEQARTALDAAGIASTTPPDAPPLPPTVDALFGWVVREGVTNVIRHSGARTCAVTWSRDDEQARLEITDDGRGAPTDGPPGGGLAGLTDRVTSAGGRLVAGPAEAGFRLSVTVPLSGVPVAVGASEVST